MTDETESTDSSFAAFEAAATTEVPIAADENGTGETVEEVKPDEAEEPEKAEEDEDKPEGKRRSKPASERIAEITRDKHEALRRAEAAEERLRALESGQEAPKPTELTEPNPDDFEFGEADSQYLRALAKYEVKVELAAEREEQARVAQQEASRAQAATLDTSWAEQAEKAVERYPDFADKVAEYKNEPCPLIMAAAIQSSEFGADVVYHLANNPKENRELAHLAETDPLEAARRFGRLEARFEGKASNDTRPTAKTITDAPEPPKHGVRGSGGRFEVDGSTTDFEAFERAANKK